MKTFQTGSKEYQMCEKWLELDVDSLAAKLAKQGAQAQMVAIDTMYQIIAVHADSQRAARAHQQLWQQGFRLEREANRRRRWRHRPADGHLDRRGLIAPLTRTRARGTARRNQASKEQ